MERWTESGDGGGGLGRLLAPAHYSLTSGAETVCSLDGRMQSAPGTGQELPTNIRWKQRRNCGTPEPQCVPWLVLGWWYLHSMSCIGLGLTG